MPREIVPSIGGGRNWSFTPVFLRSEGVGVAEAVGDAVAEITTVGTATGEDEGAGVASWARAEAASARRGRKIRKFRPALRANSDSNFGFRISNFLEGFKFKLKCRCKRTGAAGTQT
jgi:hypothetical protein